MERSETKKCQNCKSEFTIEPDDFDFYNKMKVPSPTFCPDCRLQRRMAVSNARTLYKRTCDLCKESTISMYPADTPFPVYCITCWRSDKWDAVEYGVDYDFNKTFLEQFSDLRKKVPLVALLQQGEMKNSQYTNRASNNKDCYLVFRANFNENCLYSHPISDCNDSLDCLNTQKCELTYNCIDCVNCYNVQHAQECKNCNNSQFLYDCRNCSYCFGCVGLRNKEYHIFNKAHSKEEYLKKLEEFNAGNYDFLQAFDSRFQKFTSHFIRPYMMSTHSSNVSGNWLDECKNVAVSYGCRNVEDGKNLFGIVEGKDCMDYFYWGRGCELIYETSNCGYNCSRMLFVDLSWEGSSYMQYCGTCLSCSNIFGCIGMRNREYCILNKQYSKEEYEKLMPQIVRHMDEMPYKDKKGREYKYGEFFPIELSVFAYNDTTAQDYFPLTKEQVLEQGYSWRDPEERDYKISVVSDDLPSSIEDVSDDITKEIIGCEHEGKCNEQCTTAFKIIPQELQLYKKINVPLPRLCPNCRYHARLKKRNPPRLWHKRCMCLSSEALAKEDVYKNTIEHFHGKDHCPNEFETTYAPERKEIVYCEQCYQAEVV